MFLAKIFVYVMTQDIDSDIIALKDAEKSHPEINPLIKRTVDEIKQLSRRYLAEYEKASNQLKGELLRKYHLYQTL